jgi:hypothetical protein
MSRRDPHLDFWGGKTVDFRLFFCGLGGGKKTTVSAFSGKIIS